MARTKFRNADKAYNYFLNEIILEGVNFGDTKALFNVRVYIIKPIRKLYI